MCAGHMEVVSPDGRIVLKWESSGIAVSIGDAEPGHPSKPPAGSE